MVNVSIFFKCVFLRHLKGQREKNKIPNLLHKRSPTESLFVFFSFFFFSLHATSWHRAKFPDTPLYRSSTDFSIFPLRHLVAQSRSPRRTAQSVPDRFFFLTPPRGTFFLSCFFTPPRDTEQKCPTHCSNGPRPIFLSYPTSWHIFSSFFFTPPRGTEKKSPTHCLNGPRPTFVCFFFSFLFLHHHVAHFFISVLHHLVAQSRSSRRIAKTVHNYEARQTRPNTTVRTQRTLTEASRPTLLSRDKQEKKRCKQHK